MIKISRNALVALASGGGENSPLSDLNKTYTYKNPRYFYESARQSTHFSSLLKRSEVSILAIRKSYSNHLFCANLQTIHLIRSLVSYFVHCFKSSDLDTSLRNATLSMTDFIILAQNIRLCERVL